MHISKTAYFSYSLDSSHAFVQACTACTDSIPYWTALYNLCASLYMLYMLINIVQGCAFLHIDCTNTNIVHRAHSEDSHEGTAQTVNYNNTTVMYYKTMQCGWCTIQLRQDYNHCASRPCAHVRHKVPQQPVSTSPSPVVDDCIVAVARPDVQVGLQEISRYGVLCSCWLPLPKANVPLPDSLEMGSLKMQVTPT